MNNYIFQKQILIYELCEDIIKLFEESNNKDNEMNIPKQSKKWEKIELILYKELLICINNYKNNLIINNNQQDKIKNEIINYLNKELYIKNFKIRKYTNNTSEILDIRPSNNNPNRYNFLKFIYCLNENNCEIIINNTEILLKCGNLLLFPNDLLYKIKIPILEKQFIICGELSYIEDDL
jgi:hypothetical protein